MGVVHIDNLAEGMVLADNINDRSGRLLLGTGAELTAKHLRMLRTWGVTEADIAGINIQEGGGCLANGEIDPESLLRHEAELHSLFHNVNLDYPAMAELFRLCLLRKVLNEKN